MVLARIKMKRLDQASLVRSSNEAQASELLGDHNRVLQMFDLCNQAGQSHMVRPQTAGPNIEASWIQLKTIGSPLDQAIDLRCRRGLEFTHSSAESSLRHKTGYNRPIVSPVPTVIPPQSPNPEQNITL